MKKEGSLMTIFASKMNPLCLTPTIFWAVIMALLGNDVYMAQRPHFQAALETLDIEDPEGGKSILEWLVKVFGPHIEGRFTHVDVRGQKCCVSWDNLVGPVKQVLPHAQCRTNEFLSLECYQQMATDPRFGPNYCQSCRMRTAIWVDVILSDPDVLIQQAKEAVIPFTVKLDGIELPCMSGPGKTGHWSWKKLCIGAPVIAPDATPVIAPDATPVIAQAVGGGAAMRFAVGGGAAAISVSAGKLQEPPKIHVSHSNIPMDVIFLRGIVGAGKSTYRLELQAKLEAVGNVVVIINMDSLSKAGLQKQANAIIQKEVKDGKEKAKHEGKSFILIVDVCNEHFQMRNPDAFGIQFKRDYKCHVMMPNFFADDIEGYQGWTLLWNVCERSRPVSEKDHWYLTKHGAGLSTCIRVSNDKLQKMLVSLGIPSVAAIDTTLSEEQLRIQLQPHAERYAQRVAAQGTISEIVTRYIEEEKIGEK